MNTAEIIIKEFVKSQVKTPADLVLAKRRLAKKYKIPMPTNMEMLKALRRLSQKNKIKNLKTIENILITRPVRSLSGIVNVSVLTKPYPCPGKCLYCPVEKGIPKSYVSGEPAVERAKKLNFDPYLQTKKRIEILEQEGHPTDKIEIRIIGGTWSYYPKHYREWFVKKCFEACNKENSKFKSQISPNDPATAGPTGQAKPQHKTERLKDAQRLNEKAKHRVVGLSVETRPDFIDKEEIKLLREFGVTMVELGVQSVYDNVLKFNLRGHGVKEIVSATKILKDAGFKVLYQMMPNLPDSTLNKDGKMFKELFENPGFQPDLLKIYPCAVLRRSLLYKYWKSGKYKPYSGKQMLELMKLIKKNIPFYVRIQRITRDIPSKSIIDSPAKISNLRQILANLSKKEGWRCKCIRCREVKENSRKNQKTRLFRQDYEASGGKEIFLSFCSENQKEIYSLLRLRIPFLIFSKTDNPFPFLENSAIIREVHTFGQAVPIEEKNKNASQHKGFGKKLIKEAERIAKKEFKLSEVAVISAVGARSYYRKLGYKLKNTYMVKAI